MARIHAAARRLWATHPRLALGSALGAALVIVLASFLVFSGGGGSSLEISQFIGKLEGSGMEITRYEEEIAALIGAADGCSIRVEGDSISVYQFDLSVTSGREALARLPDPHVEGVGRA